MTIPSLVSGTAYADHVQSSPTPWSTTYDSGATGSNRVLVVAIPFEQGTNVLIDTITYNSVAMTFKVLQETASTSPSRENIAFYVLANPATGSNTLTVTRLNNVTQDQAVLCATYQDVDQSIIVGDTNGNADITDTGGVDQTIAITTTAVDSLILSAAVMNFGLSGAMLPAANDTTVILETVDSNGGFTSGMYQQDAATIATYNTGFNIDPTTATAWAQVGIELLAVAASGPVITGPAGLVDGVVDTIDGSGFDTATVDLSLTGGNTVVQAVSGQTATAITITPANVVAEPTTGVPQDAVPYTITDVAAAGTTAYTLDVVVTNG